MNLTINDRNKMPHLDREEVEATIEFSGPVPNRQDVRVELAKKAKADEELVLIRQIKPVFGQSKASVQAAIYKDADSMKEIEGKHMIDRHTVEASEAEEDSEEAEDSGEESDEGDETSEAGEEPEEKKEDAAEEESGEEKKEDSEDEGDKE